jgi:hypothetical protein
MAFAFKLGLQLKFTAFLPQCSSQQDAKWSLPEGGNDHWCDFSLERNSIPWKYVLRWNPVLATSKYQAGSLTGSWSGFEVLGIKEALW